MLFGVPNDRATLVTPCEPWNFASTVPEHLKGNKPAWLTWRADPATETLLFTAAEGVNPALRCNAKSNPVAKIHALIGDYDVPVKVGGEMEANILKMAPVDLRPTWMSTSFSGHRRLVWLFESPIAFSTNISKPFLAIAERELRLHKLLPGLDKAWYNPSQLQDVGSDWVKLSDTVISTNQLHAWLVEAAKQTDWSKLGDLKIPLEDVAAEIEKQYPGQWTGAFHPGARGPCFWEGKQNPSAAIVTDAGMVAFSSHKLFHPWGEILGAAFSRKYQADRIGGAVADTWWDKRHYYRKDAHGKWFGVQKEDYALYLKVKHGISPDRARRETCSEVDRTISFVQEQRLIDGVLPAVFDQRELITANGKTYLNCSVVKPMPPADEHQEWGVNFPFLADFLDTCFDPFEQRDFFLAWWRRAYVGALQGNFEKGHALFVAGGVGKGKTLLGTRMIGDSLGGAADASDFMSSATDFNKELLEVAVWLVDDAKTSSDPAAHKKWTETVKRCCANPLWNYHAKFKDSVRAEWNGRLFCSLNSDSYSLAVLPDLAASLEEKILLLNFSETKRKFPPKRELENTIRAELPYLLRFLADWEIPAHIVGENRFGIKNYIHEELRNKALHSGGVGDLLELIDLWLDRAAPGEKYGDTWQGSASEWLTIVGTDDALRPLVSKFSPKMVGKRFSEASRIKDSGVELAVANGKHGNRYRINLMRDPKPSSVVRVTPEVEQAVA